MIKKSLFYFLLGYLGLYVLLMLWLYGFHGRPLHDLFTSSLIFFFAVFGVMGIGVFLGMVISVIVQRPTKEKIFYMTGQIVSLVACCALVFFSADLSSSPSKLPNGEENIKTVRDFNSNPEPPGVWLAFDSLRD